MICFTIYGIPQPQGSTRAFIPKGWSRPVITTDNKSLKPWRQDVSQTAQLEMQKAGLSIVQNKPIFLCANFYFDRPKSLKKSIVQKITKPDLDKLFRALSDALTGIVFKDDSQIVASTVVKSFGAPRMEVGVQVLDIGTAYTLSHFGGLYEQLFATPRPYVPELFPMELK